VRHRRPRVPSIIVGSFATAIVALSRRRISVRTEPLLVQARVDATRLDIAARSNGRVKGNKPVERPITFAAGVVLFRSYPRRVANKIK